MKKDSNTQDLVEKYIYDVVRRLPQGQRQDIELELRSIIEDMIENSLDDSESLEDILKKLGAPSELARKYREEGKYLIGPEYYDLYCLVLKIVVICSFVGVVISGIISFITNVGNLGMSLSDLIELIIRNITEPIVSLIGVFGVVTLIFASIERQKIRVEMTNGKDWVPSELPEIPAKKALLSRGEAAVELVVIIILFGILIFAPQMMGVWVKDGEHVRSMPIFNLDIWGSVFPLFLICLVLNLIEVINKLVVGRYGAAVAVVSTVTNIISFGMTVIIFKYFPIWNPNFVTELEIAFQRTVNSKGDILSYWGSDLISNVLLGIIFLCVVIEIASVLYKSIRYGNYLRN